MTDFIEQDPNSNSEIVTNISSKIDLNRLEAARANRRVQLEKWMDYESQITKQELPPKDDRKNRVEFIPGCILLDAALKDDIAEVKFLLEHNSDPNAAKEDGLTPLHQACINENVDICKLLLDYGADVNARDAELWTPLHAAANCGNEELCSLLLSRGADILAINVEGSTPYDLTEMDEASEFFLEEFTKRNITPSDVDSARTAPEQAMIDELAFMYSNGESLNELDSQGAAPLHIAAACGYSEAADMLLRMGVAPDTRDAEDWTPAQVAVCWNQIEVLEVLISHGADLTIANPNGETALTLAEHEDIQAQVLQVWDNRENLQAIRAKIGTYQMPKPICRRASSSSIHRSSMRQKSNVSKRAVMEEVEMAKNLNTNDGDTEEVKHGSQTPTPISESEKSNSNKHLKVKLTDDQDSSSEAVIKENRRHRDQPRQPTGYLSNIPNVDNDKVESKIVIVRPEKIDNVKPRELQPNGTIKNREVVVRDERKSKLENNDAKDELQIKSETKGQESPSLLIKEETIPKEPKIDDNQVQPGSESPVPFNSCCRNCTLL